jgi:hypothetical protein
MAHVLLFDHVGSIGEYGNSVRMACVRRPQATIVSLFDHIG